MSKQSSVEWLIDQIDFDANTRWFSQPEWFAIYQKAKAMHKEEIEEAHYDGSIITLLKPNDDMLKQSEQYYKETFGNEEVL